MCDPYTLIEEHESHSASNDEFEAIDFSKGVFVSLSDILFIEDVIVPDRGDGITAIAKLTLAALDEFGNNKTILAIKQPALEGLRKYFI